MKYAAILSVGLAAIASASIGERDAAPYKKVVQNITSAVENLDSVVQQYNGGDKQAVLDASNALVKSLDDGKTTIDGLDDLNASDAGPLSGDLMTLSSKSQALTDELKSKRGDVEQASECDSVRKAIGDINTSAQALVKAAVSKIPKTLQPLAQGFVSDFTKSFNDTQDYFSTTNCQNGKTSTASTGSSGSSTAGATSSPTSSQTAAASPKGSNGASLLAPVWTLGAVMAVFAVYC